MIQQAKAILKNVFGYENFRPLQQEIIQNVLDRKDTLVIMPTGGGKSLCYQIPAMVFEALTVVVSPLISLMKDQVEQLAAAGVGAVALNSMMSSEAYGRNVSRILRNDAKLLYLAPETLIQPKTLAMLNSRRVDCVAIDEAHCISEWGHDFRPEYRQLLNVRKQFPQAVCVALTATATPQVQKDIQNCLNFEKSNAFVASFNRTNLFLQISPKTDPIRQTMDFIHRFPAQPGIVYCLARRQVDDLTAVLVKSGLSARAYHAGLADDERRRSQEAFIRDDVQIMVATVAFGMGINKPNIRFVLHYDLPQNIESYYQQIGRAGRDGLRAHCLLLFGYSDIHKIKYFINQKSDQEKRVAALHLRTLIHLAETDECRRISLLAYFGERYALPRCGMCDNCTSGDPVLSDLTIPAQKFMSCVKRSGEIFGSDHLIDILRGARTQKILKFNHHELSTYGIGKDWSKRQWLYLGRQLVQKEFLTEDIEHGSLKLTDNGWEVLRGKALFLGKTLMETKAPSSPKTDEPPYDTILFGLLRQKRKELADTANMPPYVIFSDKTLIEMTTSRPQSVEAMRGIHGIGAVKLEKYGQIFADEITTYCHKDKIATSPEPITDPVDVPERQHIRIGKAFNAGQSMDNIMQENSIKLSTILGYLYQFFSDGNSLRYGNDFLPHVTLAPDKQAAVFEIFDRLGTDHLKPVFDALNNDVSYSDLHLLRLHHISRKFR